MFTGWSREGVFFRVLTAPEPGTWNTPCLLAQQRWWSCMWRGKTVKHHWSSLKWIIIDAKIYDISKFKNMHPGGASVFFDADIRQSSHTCFLIFSWSSWTAGQDATEAFYGLHRHEVITKPQYARLQIGVLEGEKSVIHGRVVGELSKVPYAEPTWLSDGYYSPYYTEVCSTPPLAACQASILPDTHLSESPKVPEGNASVYRRSRPSWCPREFFCVNWWPPDKPVP